MDGRRTAILDAAATRLVRDGLSRFSTTAVCEEAGISMGALYRHFASREAILLGIAERAIAQWRVTLDTTSFSRFRTSVVALLHLLCAEGGRNTARLDFELVAAGTGYPAIAEVLSRRVFETELSLALGQLAARGELPDGVDETLAADALAALIAGQVYLIAAGGAIASPPGQLVDLALGPAPDRGVSDQ